MKFLSYFLLGFLGFLLVGCSDDSNDSTFSAFFFADNDLPHDNSVSLQPGYESELKFEIDVVATGIDLAPVGSISFDLRFCPEYYEFRKYAKGNYLEQGGAVSYNIAVDSGDPGLLHVEILAASESSGGADSGTFVILSFKGKKEGEDFVCPFTFENQELRDINQPIGALITGISWFAGKARIYD